MAEQGYKNRLQIQITAYFILGIVLAINIIAWLLYFQTERYFDENLGKHLVGIAQSAADLMEADLLEFIAPGDEQGALYQSFQKTLLTFRDDFQVSRVYVIDEAYQLLIDTQPGSITGSDIPYLQSSLVELEKTKANEALYTTLYRGADGNLYKSAFAPILDNRQQINAIACVDASPDYLQVIDQMRNAIIYINLISLIVSVLIGVLLARSIVNPVTKLVNIARRISKGDLTQSVEITVKNEIGFLGQVVNEMQDNIKAQQEKLESLKYLAETRADTLQSYNDYILQSIDNGILTTDLSGKITVFNTEAARILKTNGKSVGKHYQEVFDQTHPFHKILETIPEQLPAKYVMEAELAYPEPMPVTFQVSWLRDADQAVIGTNWVLTDVSELQKLQRTVQEKEQMAYLGMLSAAVAHEIRNPLNSIELFMGLMKRQASKNPQQVTTIQKVRTEIRALNRIVTDFLVFARSPKIERRTLLLSRLLQEAILLAEEAIREKQITVQFNLPDKKIFIDGDFPQLKQAMLNLFLNAVQSMPTAGILTITATEIWSAGSSQIKIVISDSGKGIARKDLPKIFQPFYSTRNQGTGLGLAIVKNIVQAHLGTIVVNSKIGKGTDVVIELPKAAGA